MNKNPYPGVVPAPSGAVGKWRIYANITENGKLIRKSKIVSAKNEKGAYNQLLKWRNELEEEYENSPAVIAATKGISFNELADMWLPFAESHMSEKTMQTYRGYLKNYLKPFWGDTNIRDITKGTVFRFQDYLRDVKKLENKNNNNIIVQLSSMLTYAEDREMIAFNPCIKVKKLPVKKASTILYFDENQMSAIMNQLDKDIINLKESFDTSIKYSRLKERERIRRQNLKMAEALAKRFFVHLCTVTGARRGEVMGLTWNNIEIMDDCCRVTFNGTMFHSVGKGPQFKDSLKNNDKSKTVYMTLSILPYMDEYKKQLETVIEENGWTDKEHVFLAFRPGKINPAGGMPNGDTYTTWFSKWCKDNMKALGLSEAEAEKAHVHMLRHTFVSYELNNGVSLSVTSRLAGHSSTAVTDQIYSHIADNKFREAATTFEGFYKNLKANNSDKQ